MLLAVDAGNTQTVYGLFDGPRRLASWRVATRREATADEIGLLLRGLLREHGLDPTRVAGIIVSSVVPDLDATLARVGETYFSRRPLFVGPELRTDLPILYDNPLDVGADRIVNAVAARARFGAPVIVLDFGTATTFDVVGAGGEYLGGIIAPGPGLSAAALFERAARLRPVALRRPPRAIGRTTEHSLQSGLFLGYVALIEGLVRRIREELGHEAPVVATGGLAPLFESELAWIAAVDVDLTLEGLRLLWDANRS